MQSRTAVTPTDQDRGDFHGHPATPFHAPDRIAFDPAGCGVGLRRVLLLRQDHRQEVLRRQRQRHAGRRRAGTQRLGHDGGIRSKLYSSTKPTDVRRYRDVRSLAPGTDYSRAKRCRCNRNWVQSSPLDSDGNPINPQTGIHVTGGNGALDFGNYCTESSAGRTPGFWSNKNGLNTLMDGGTLAPEFTILSACTCGMPAALDFDPVTYPAIPHLAARQHRDQHGVQAVLAPGGDAANVEAGFVNGNRIYAPFGGTVNQLMTLADNSLASDPSDADRQSGARLPGAVEELPGRVEQRRAAGVPHPCTITFPRY